MRPNPECPVCKVTMEEGHVIDRGDSNHLYPLQWTEGPAEKGGINGMRIKGKRQIQIGTFRCPRCGWLIWFAPESGE